MRPTAGVALVGLLCATAAATVVATPGAPPTPKCRHFDDVEGHGVGETARLFSRDVDDWGTDDFETLRDRYADACGHDPTDAALLLLLGDYTWPVPPTTDAYRDWNRRGRHGALSRTVGGADTVSSGAVEAAAAVVATYPSTHIHGERGRRWYVAPDGSLTGTLAFDVDVPDDGTSDGGTARSYTTYRRAFTTVSATCSASSDGATVDGACGPRSGARRRQQDATISLDYALPAGWSGTLTYRAIVRVGIREWTHECTNYNETAGECEGIYLPTRVSTSVSTVTVTDGVRVRAYGPPDVTVRAARFPSGRYRVRITTDDPVARVTLGGGQRIVWPWRFYTASAVGHGVPDSTLVDDLQPLWLYAVPARKRVAVRGGPAVVEVRGPRRSTAGIEIGEHVDVALAEGYVSPTVVTIRNVTRYRPERIRVVGIVPGVNATGDAVDARRPVRVRRSEIAVERLGHNRTHVTLRVELTGSDGNPIHTAARSGYLTVGGRRVQTGPDGEAVVTVRRRGFAPVAYHPAPWYAVDRPYAANATTVQFSPSGDGIVGTIVAETRSFLWIALPIAVVLYALDRLPGIDAWPPWRGR